MTKTCECGEAFDTGLKYSSYNVGYPNSCPKCSSLRKARRNKAYRAGKPTLRRLHCSGVIKGTKPPCGLMSEQKLPITEVFYCRFHGATKENDGGRSH